VSAFKILLPAASAPSAVRASAAEVDPVPPFGMGISQLTDDANGICPFDGSVPSLIRTRLLAPTGSQSLELDAFLMMISSRFVIGSLRFPAPPVFENDK